MKKVFFGLALIAASAFSVMAGNNSQNPQAPQTVCTSKAVCASKNACCEKNAPKAKCVDVKSGCENKNFEGINLTNDQKAKISALNESLFSEEKICKNKELTKEQKNEIRKMKESKRAETRENYLKGIKEILTADQYVIFLENNYRNQGSQRFGNPMKAKKFKGKMKHHGRPECVKMEKTNK